MNASETLALLAPDLTRNFPRSPRECLAGFVVAARALDKCRAVVAGTRGEYHFDCPLDPTFLNFAGLDAGAFKEFVASGATDAEVAAGITENARVKDTREIIVWNNKMRYTRPCDMPLEVQEFLEGYIANYIPRNWPVGVWFDVYDLEEQRI